MRSERCRFVPHVDFLLRRIVLDASAAALATPTIAPDDAQDTSSEAQDSSDANAATVSYAASTDSSDQNTSGNGSSSTDCTAVDSALGDLLGPNDGDDGSGYDPDSTDLPDDSEFTSAVPVSGVGAY
jgi:hypothetical protein